MHDFQNIITSVVPYVQSWLKYQNKAMNQLCVDVSKPEPVPKLNFDWLLLQENVERGLEQPIRALLMNAIATLLQFSNLG